MSSLGFKQRLRLIVGGVFLTLLLAAVFTLGSLDVPFEPKNWREVFALYALSCFVTAALLVFGLILTRTLLRLWAERSSERLGARFKTKMVLGAMGISLLPVLFMFFVSYALLNRTLGRWFPRPLEIASEQNQKLLNDLGSLEKERLVGVARKAMLYSSFKEQEFLRRAFQAGADASWVVDNKGKTQKGGTACKLPDEYVSSGDCQISGVPGRFVRTLPNGLEIWEAKGDLYLSAKVPVLDVGEMLGFVVAGRRTTPDFLLRYADIEQQLQAYEQEKQHLRALKTQMLLILLLFTLLLLFGVMWIALFLAKQVTVPIQALAEGTRNVSTGNFEYQVPEQAQDELGVLVRSFNVMTTQLRDSRGQIDEFTRNLQQAVQELERRRQLMETILENIPTGVLSLDASGNILRGNPAITRIFNGPARNASTLEDLLGAEASRAVNHLMRRSLRMGVVSREIEIVLQGHVLHAAVTVSSLGPRRANMGYVVVLDDVTEMLRAQKAAAWQEVARRIAHEIKNPLTPIQLSAQRLARFLDRRDPSSDSASPRETELISLVQECSRLIEREASTLSSLVNEFSQFVRFPVARLAPTDANAVVRQALDVFAGRLDGVTLKTSLDEHLPPVRADDGLLRSVLVNLIDNAAEALEHATVKEIRVSTCTRAEADTIEIRVEDTGHGISPEDKDKLFLPNFSTKERGTGLGLAIAARIVAEHGGRIRVEDNSPVGSRFYVELPVMEPVGAHPSEPV